MCSILILKFGRINFAEISKKLSGITFFLFLCHPLLLFSQSVGIGSGTFTPDASAMLEIQSTNSGLLIPRMTTAQRTAISSPATGLLVYDTDTKSFWYYDGTWKQIGSSQSGLTDSDGDTKIQVEESTDEDIIRFDLGGTEKWLMTGSRLEPNNTGNSLFIGYQAGLSDDLSDNYNVFIGFQAGKFNTSGYYNSAMGVQALYSNTTGYKNSAMGYGALYSNKANSRSTAIGYNAMYYADNTTYGRETYNTAVGYEALRGSTSVIYNVGRFNTAIGEQALYSNSRGYSNSAMGV